MTATDAAGEAPSAERRPGRPRDLRADAAIRQAAIEVLADKGPGGFTVDEVAARAGCGKATIYRRWPSRANLLLDTAHSMGLEPELVDTGSVRGDLALLITQLAGKLHDTAAGRIMPGVMAEAAVNPEMREVLSAFVQDRRKRPREVVQRAVARGQLPPGTDVELVLDLVGAVPFYRELVSGQSMDERYAERVVDVILAAVCHQAAADTSSESSTPAHSSTACGSP
jgi:AcrR family transcriptional regulator